MADVVVPLAASQTLDAAGGMVMPLPLEATHPAQRVQRPHWLRGAEATCTCMHARIRMIAEATWLMGAEAA